MKNRKALFITCSFPPVGDASAQRTARFVEHLPEYGWEPMALTLREDQQMLRNRDYSLANLLPKNMLIERTDMIEPFNNALYRMLCGDQRTNPKKELSEDKEVQDGQTPSTFKRLKQRLSSFAEGLTVPDRYMGWIPYAIPAGRRLIETHSPDLIVSCSPTPTAHVVANALVKRYNLPWVQDFHDPWTRYAFALKRIFPFNRFERRFEKKILHRAKTVVVTAQALIDEYREMYPEVPEEKYRLIYYGYDENRFREAVPLVFDKYTMVFTGTSYDVPVYRDLFAGIRRSLEQRPEMRADMQILFMGHAFGGLDRLIASYGLSDVVKNLGYKSQAECTCYMLGAHTAFYYIYHYNQISCKIFEYLRSGVSVFAILPESHEVKAILNEAGSGTVSPLGDVEAIARNFLQSYQRYQNGGFAQSQQSVEMAQRFEWNLLARQFAEVATEAVAEA